MKTLNLKEFKLFTDISRAFRILHSEGGIEVSDEEELIIVDTAKMCKAVFYDSIMSALKKE